MESTTRTVVYGDFTCVKCALASARTDLLHAAGNLVEWRAVESEVGLPVRGRRRTAQYSDQVDAARTEFSRQLRTGESMPQDLPDLVPRTTAAVSVYAEAVVAGIPDQARGLLFAAYWTHGTDIGDPEVLRTLLAAELMSSDATSDPIARFGHASAMTREPITGAAWRLIRGWRDDWRQLQCNELPLVTDLSGTYSGDAALRRLAYLLDQTHAVADRGDPDVLCPVQDWEPLTTVDPPQARTSQVGDPWRRARLIRRVGGVADPVGWRDQAACRGEDPELFFPVGTAGPAAQQTEQAKSVCRRCPVIDDCLDFAMAGQEEGIWGGTTTDERRSRRGAAPRLGGATKPERNPAAEP